MSSLTMLVRNENTKIYRRPRTWIIVLFLVVIIALMSGVIKWNEVKYSPTTNWQEQLTAQNQEYKRMLAEQQSEKSADGLSYFEQQIIINDYYLEKQVNPNVNSVWSYMNSATSLVILISILTVIIAADMIAAEFSWGTIKLLLVGPATRTKVLLAKYVATLQFALLLLLICFFTSFIAGIILGGFNSWQIAEVFVNGAGQLEEKTMIISILQKYGLGIVQLLMYVTMAFMISAAFRSSTMAIGFSFISIFMGNMVVGLLSNYEWVKYILFANIDLSQYLYDSPLRPEMTLSFSVMMLAIYFVVFHFITWIMFTKRDVAG